MEAAASPDEDKARDESCRVLGRDELPAGTLHRFLVGRDDGPQLMSQAEAERDLNDPFATELLRKGRFPATGEEVLAALDEAVTDDHPLAKKTQRSFLVGEGTQLAKDPAKKFNRNFRFVVSRGTGTDGPDLILSVGDPARVGEQVEVVAWDAQNGGFNYYRTGSGSEAGKGVWLFAGNSRHACDPDLRAKGPFMSHPSGNILMKELKVPWNNWASPKAPVDARDFAAGDSRATHEWFTNQAGAYVLEDSVVRLSIRRWNRRRLEEIQEAGSVDATPLLEQLLGSPDNQRHTVNLVSSPDSSASAASADRLRLPTTFFVDADMMATLGLEQPAAEFTAPAAFYKQALEKFGVTVRNHDKGRPLDGDEPFEPAGDTHFAWLVPERAFEDVDLLRQLLGHPQVNLINLRLAICLVMVDFPNPVFSAPRASLIRHFPTDAIPADRWAGLSKEVGDQIAAAAAEGSPEAEFAALWQVSDGALTDAANELLRGYYQRVSEQLETQEGFERYFQLAESRRDRVRKMPIDETPLLFAQTNLDAEMLQNLAMARDATVVERSAT